MSGLCRLSTISPMSRVELRTQILNLSPKNGSHKHEVHVGHAFLTLDHMSVSVGCGVLKITHACMLLTSSDKGVCRATQWLQEGLVISEYACRNDEAWRKWICQSGHYGLLSSCNSRRGGQISGTATYRFPHQIGPLFARSL